VPRSTSRAIEAAEIIIADPRERSHCRCVISNSVQRSTEVTEAKVGGQGWEEKARSSEEERCVDGHAQTRRGYRQSCRIEEQTIRDIDNARMTRRGQIESTSRESQTHNRNRAWRSLIGEREIESRATQRPPRLVRFHSLAVTTRCSYCEG